MLADTEDVAGAAEFEIGFGDAKTVGRFFEGGEAFQAFRLGGVGEEKAIALKFSARDAAAQLVQLRQAEAIGIENRHERGVRDIDADFDDGGGDEGVKFPVAEGRHDVGALLTIHAAMHEADAETLKFVRLDTLINMLRARCRLIVVGLGEFDARADEIGLAAFAQLLAEKIPGLVRAVAVNAAGDDALAAGRKLGHDGEIKVAELGEAETAGDGRGSHDEDMRLLHAGGESGALANAEAVLFVDDGET